jgi:hypothetical protein
MMNRDSTRKMKNKLAKCVTGGKYRENGYVGRYYRCCSSGKIIIL